MNLVSLNDLVTELTQRIAQLTLSQADSQAESEKTIKELQKEIEELKMSLSETEAKSKRRANSTKLEFDELKLSLTETKKESNQRANTTHLAMEEMKRDLVQVKEDIVDLQPRDGGWTEFGNWSDCSAECGEGTQTRTRNCTDPSLAREGAACEGEGEETRICNAEPCPVNGGWTSWYSGSCSVPCGDGSETKIRTCTNPAPAHGGADCSGTGTYTRPCNNGICTNIARQGTATQTDTAGPGYASNAIDGNTDGNWHHGSVTHTISKGSDAWWKLTFSNPVYIDAIEVYHRTDCCTNRIDGTLYIDEEVIGSLMGSRGNPNRISPIRKVGTKVTLRATVRDHLNIAEVLVYGAFIEEY